MNAEELKTLIESKNINSIDLSGQVIEDVDFSGCTLTNVNFKKALWDNMVDDNLPLVVSTTFGGFGHIVCVTGVQYKKSDYEALRAAKDLKASNVDELVNLTDPVAIIVDDPWGKYNPKTNKYDAPNGGNDIVVPWDVVVARVKPAGSTLTKWCHQIDNYAKRRSYCA